MHARFYDPGAGRFLSVEPEAQIEEAVHDPRAWNRYAYVRNNPLRSTDPTGKYVCRGTEAECTTIETGIQRMSDAAANLKKNDPRRADLNKVIKAFGKPGDPKSQISIVWANPNGLKLGGIGAVWDR